MNREQSRKADRRGVVYATTVGSSAHSLLRGQLKWMKSQGWHVTLVTTPDPAARAAAEREGVDLHGIPMERPVRPIRDITALVRWITLLRRIRPQAVNVGTPKAGLLGIIAAWITGVPRRIYIVRGLRLEGAAGPMKALLWLMEWLATRLASDVIVVSRSLGNEMQDLHLDSPHKTWLIGEGSSNGVDVDGIASRASGADRGRVRRELGLSDARCVIGFIGRITPDKGVDTLLDALPYLDDDVKVLIIGMSEDVVIENRIKELSSLVKYIPWTDDVWGYLPAIDVLCLPSLREGFPTVILEAAAAGIPAVTTAVTGAIDAVVEGRTGYIVNPGDPKALADRIAALIGSEEDAERMGKAARRRVEESFRSEYVWTGVAEIVGGEERPRNARLLKHINNQGGAT